MLNLGAISNSSSVEVSGTLDISESSFSTVALSRVTGSGTIGLGSKNLAFSNSAGGTFAGTITNSALVGTGGSVIKNTADTLHLTGTNNYIGGTTINAGTLNINSDAALGLSTTSISITGSSTLQLAATIGSMARAISIDAAKTLTIDTNGFNLTNSGIFSGSGSLLIQGPGTVSVSGASSGFTGTTTVNNATLNLNSSIFGGDIIINSSATLSGSGTMANLTSSGTISPGNSLGTLTVTNLILNASSVLQIEVNDAGQSDLINASGTATLDGTLDIILNPGVYATGTIYTIITTAPGGVMGTFASKTELGARFNVIYNSDSVQLSLASLVFLDLTSNNPNITNVINNINAIADSPSSAALIDTYITPILSQNPAFIENALNQLQPFQYSAFGEESVQLGHFLTLFFESAVSPLCCHNRNEETTTCKDPQWSVWVQPYSFSFRLKEYDLQPKCNFFNSGFAAGIDIPLYRELVIGIGGVYNYNSLRWSNNRGKGHIESGFLSLFSDWTNDRVFVGGTVLGGIDFIRARRHIEYLTVDASAKSFHRGYDAIGQLRAGILINPDHWLISPLFRLNYLYNYQPGFTEHGAGPADLVVSSNTNQTFQSDVAIEFKRIWNLNQGCIVPSFGVEFNYQKQLERENYSSYFIGETISLTSFGYRSSLCLFSFPVKIAGSYKNWVFSGSYTPQFGTHFWGQFGRLEARYEF